MGQLYLTDICKALDIKMVKNSQVNMLRKDQNGLAVYVGEQWYIIYDETMPLEEKRFTLAHELGHIFLNHKRKESLLNDNAQEYEADIFAEGLLNLLAALEQRFNTVPKIYQFYPARCKTTIRLLERKDVAE